MKKILTYPLLLTATIALSACQTTGVDRKADSKESISKEQRLDAAIEKAAITASKSGSTSAKLLALEKQYKRNSSDPESALAYARALRQVGHVKRAALILEPFAKDDNAIAGAKTEMSMIALGMSEYDVAEKYAQQAVIQDPTDHYAFQNLGIALDAKEMHAEAERAFRKGLEHWEGDPTTIMNNLALNLATQGFIDEAIEILERAKAISPDRIEIERNLRIIRTLNER